MKEAYLVDIEIQEEGVKDKTPIQVVVIATDFVHIKRKVTHYLKTCKLPTEFKVVYMSRVSNGSGNVT